MRQESAIDHHSFGSFLLDAGIALLRAGASASGIRRTVERFAYAYEVAYHLDIGPKTLSLSLMNAQGEFVFSGNRSAANYGADFKIITGITSLSWRVESKSFSIQELNDELNRLLCFSAYPRWIILVAVSIAGAAFCYTFGGSILEMSIAFGATFAGLITKQELIKKSANAYICTFLSSVVAALFIGVFYFLVPDRKLEHAFSTCTLFLIPGLPLINFIIDLLAGNILFGLERGINAVLHAFAIALGMTTVLYIFNIVS